MTFQRILIAVDGSPIADRAAERGFELARSLGATVALLHVVDPEPLPEGGAARAEHDGRQLLAEVGRRSSLDPATFVVLGKPATEIVATARQWQADLVVIGSHGRGRIERLLIGSVAEAVLRHAPCAVLVMRAAA